MLRSVLIFLFAAVWGVCPAQNIEAFKAKLARTDSLGQGHIRIVEHGKAGQTAETLSRSAMVSSIKGYHVRIFIDNSQNARSIALETQSRFKEMFPDIYSATDYKSPWWKVVVGNCLTKEEAIMLKGRIEGSFSQSVIAEDDSIPLSRFME